MLLLRNNRWTRLSPFWPWKRPTHSCFCPLSPAWEYLGRESKWLKDWLLPLDSNKSSLLSVESNMLLPQTQLSLLLISLSVTMMKHQRSGFMALLTQFTEVCLNLELLGNYTKASTKINIKVKSKAYSENLNDCPCTHIIKEYIINVSI